MITLEPEEIVESLIDNNWSLKNTDRLFITRLKQVARPDVLNTDYIIITIVSESEQNVTITLPGEIDTDATVRCDIRTRSFDEVKAMRNEIRRIIHDKADLRLSLPASNWSTIMPRRTIKRNNTRGDSYWQWMYDLGLTRRSEQP